MSNEEINISADFYTFKNQIVDKFGEFYYEQACLFFDRATEQAKQGLLLSALADGKFALELTDYSNDKSGAQYLIGFLSQLHCDMGEIAKSKSYYHLGINLLDEESEDYEDDLEMYRRLKEHIDGESWKGSIEDY